MSLADALGAGVLSAITLARGGARLNVLTFHRVLAAPDPLLPDDLDQRSFRALLRMIRSLGRIVDLEQGVRDICERRTSGLRFAVTFDDGYRNNFDLALPVLKELGVPATFFVASGFLDGGRMWNDTLIESIRHARIDRVRLDRLGLDPLPVVSLSEKLQAIKALQRILKLKAVGERDAVCAEIAAECKSTLPDDLMMTSAQVRDLALQGMKIGSHTISHAILSRADRPDAALEIIDGRKRLQDISQTEVALFAYPNGRPDEDFDATHVAMVRSAGFRGAVMTGRGTFQQGTDPFQIPRFTPWGASRARIVYQLARNVWPNAGLEAGKQTLGGAPWSSL